MVVCAKLAAVCLGLCALAPVVLADETEAAARAAVLAAAEDRGCTVLDPARDIRRLNVPLNGIFQVRCADTHIIWFHKVDGAWTLRPLG